MIKRRSFLLNMVAAGLFGSIPVRWAGFLSPYPHPYLEPELLTMLDDPFTIKEIGRAYLNLYPDHRNRNKLLNHLDSQIGPVRTNNLKTRISRCVREDFAAGDTIQLNGWILSHTEAQQCALYSLT